MELRMRREAAPRIYEIKAKTGGGVGLRGTVAVAFGQRHRIGEQRDKANKGDHHREECHDDRGYDGRHARKFGGRLQSDRAMYDRTGLAFVCRVMTLWTGARP